MVSECITWDFLSMLINHIPIAIAFVSIIIAYKTLDNQKKHNMKSVRPIVDILIGDYEEDIHVKLRNQGVGPAIINEIVCEYFGNIAVESTTWTSLIDLLGEPAFPSSKVTEYGTFVENINGRTIAPGGEIVLVSLMDGNLDENHAIRSILKDTRIRVNYQDIYDNSFFAERELVFFGRNL